MARGWKVKMKPETLARRIRERAERRRASRENLIERLRAKAATGDPVFQELLEEALARREDDMPRQNRRRSRRNPGFEYLDTQDRVGEWVDEFFRVHRLRDPDGDEVEVVVPPRNVIERGESEPVEIIWESALDFDGTWAELCRRDAELCDFLDRGASSRAPRCGCSIKPTRWRRRRGRGREEEGESEEDY